MNLASVAVLVVVLALAALAVRRAWKKGAPCECGGSHKACHGGEGCCCCGEGKGDSQSPVCRLSFVVCRKDKKD